MVMIACRLLSELGRTGIKDLCTLMQEMLLCFSRQEAVQQESNCTIPHSIVCSVYFSPLLQHISQQRARTTSVLAVLQSRVTT